MKRPLLSLLIEGVYKQESIHLFYLLVLYKKELCLLPKRKKYQHSFYEDELTLLDEFEKYRKQNYINRSGWVKQHMKKELPKTKDPMLLDEMKSLIVYLQFMQMLRRTFSQVTNEGC